MSQPPLEEFSEEAINPDAAQTRSLSPPGVSVILRRPLLFHTYTSVGDAESSMAQKAIEEPSGDHAGSRIRSISTGRSMSPSEVEMKSLSRLAPWTATATESPPGENAHTR